MRMRRRQAGQVISAVGLVCLLASGLIGLSGPATNAGRAGSVLLYSGFLMLLVGAVLYLLAKSPR